MKPWRDPNHRGNSLQHAKLGRKCIERGCNEPAGTAWSPLWCFRHNAERMDRIDAQFERLAKALEDAVRHIGGAG